MGRPSSHTALGQTLEIQTSSRPNQHQGTSYRQPRNKPHMIGMTVREMGKDWNFPERYRECGVVGFI
jgi:site-specific DNA-cytosine methylase